MKLRYTNPALADLQAILIYISAHSSQGALRVHHRIQRAIEVIEMHPEIGTRTADPTIRRHITAPYPYLIFYEPTDTEIIIHAIRHAARKPHTP